jgi:hypothetical protein
MNRTPPAEPELTDSERAVLEAVLKCIIRRRVGPIAPFLHDAVKPIAQELIVPILDRIAKIERESRAAIANHPELIGRVGQPMSQPDQSFPPAAPGCLLSGACRLLALGARCDACYRHVL